MYQPRQRKYAKGAREMQTVQEKAAPAVHVGALIQRAAKHPQTVSPAEWMQLQSSVGHQATRDALGSTVQRMEMEGPEQEEEELQMKRSDETAQRMEMEGAEQEEEELQMKRSDETAQLMDDNEEEEQEMSSEDNEEELLMN